MNLYLNICTPTVAFSAGCVDDCINQIPIYIPSNPYCIKVHILLVELLATPQSRHFNVFLKRDCWRGMEESGQLKRALIDASAGAISGGISRTVTSPLDVIKIRFQVQLEPTTQWALLRRDAFSQSKYTGMLQATKDIFREEGLPGFWRGNVPALLMVMPYTAIQFTVLHKLKSFVLVHPKDHINISSYLSYVSGALAGCAATVGSYPFDLIRTLLASQGEPKVYPNMRAAFSDILIKRGFRGLYAGLTPTRIEIVPYAGLQFGTYDTFKRWTMVIYYDLAPALSHTHTHTHSLPDVWNRYRPGYDMEADDTLSSFQLFLCGLAAGIVLKLYVIHLMWLRRGFRLKGCKVIQDMELEWSIVLIETCMMHYAKFCIKRVGSVYTKASPRQL
ncbi:hypothetical protein SASPL_109274 [Salvia splendens]|uniref:Solute carrier family 25 (Mitochondrial thiamine pyrophosphate transporter), member 19 n=1 Tax=Salvia splendens TaxID=180675 RepID=A0A8X8YIA3_SALSN|nr:hypothetical protein SASPL_109274 [Salvia splendens]